MCLWSYLGFPPTPPSPAWSALLPSGYDLWTEISTVPNTILQPSHPHPILHTMFMLKGPQKGTVSLATLCCLVLIPVNPVHLAAQIVHLRSLSKDNTLPFIKLHFILFGDSTQSRASFVFQFPLLVAISQQAGVIPALISIPSWFFFDGINEKLDRTRLLSVLCTILVWLVCFLESDILCYTAVLNVNMSLFTMLERKYSNT